MPARAVQVGEVITNGSHSLEVVSTGHTWNHERREWGMVATLRFLDGPRQGEEVLANLDDVAALPTEVSGRGDA